MADGRLECRHLVMRCFRREGVGDEALLIRPQIRRVNLLLVEGVWCWRDLDLFRQLVLSVFWVCPHHPIALVADLRRPASFCECRGIDLFFLDLGDEGGGRPDGAHVLEEHAPLRVEESPLLERASCGSREAPVSVDVLIERDDVDSDFLTLGTDLPLDLGLVQRDEAEAYFAGVGESLAAEVSPRRCRLGDGRQKKYCCEDQRSDEHDALLLRRSFIGRRAPVDSGRPW